MGPQPAMEVNFEWLTYFSIDSGSLGITIPLKSNATLESEGGIAFCRCVEEKREVGRAEVLIPLKVPARCPTNKRPATTLNRC